jgi:chromosome segregation protein
MAQRAAKKKTARRRAAAPPAEGTAPHLPAQRQPGTPPVAAEAERALLPEDLDPLQFIKDFDSQLDVLLDVKQSLETDLAETRAQIAHQRRTNEEMMHQLQELEAEVQRQAGVRNELEFLHGEIGKAGEDLKARRELLEEKKTTAARKDERIEKLQTGEKEVRAEITSLRESQTQVRNERAETDSHLQVAKLERNELALEIRKLQEVLTRDEQRAQNVEAELEQARMALSKLHGSFEVSKRKAERILKK